MIHEINDPAQKQDDTGFYYPRYDKDCISSIPGSILDLFGVKHDLTKLPFDLNIETNGVNKVVMFVLDGFGHNQFLRYHNEQKFLSSLAKKSQVFPITSIFPSQTTNALTTLNTGLTPQEHGLFEYYIYIKEVDRIVNTLRFEPLGSRIRNELIDKGFSPDILFNGHTIQSKLKDAGIKSFTHIYASYAYSHYSRLLFNDSTFIPSLKSSDLIVTLKKKLEQEKGPAYFFVHLSNLDTISHEYGPNSYEYGAELSAISYLMQKELIEKIAPQTAKETFLMLTADHGGVNIVPEDTTYLNGYTNILNNLQKGSSGNTILPTGSARDVFLHVQPEKIGETQDLLTKRVGQKAKVVETKEAIKDGLFGQGKVSNQFVDRVGNMLILPYRNETVWFEHFKEIKYNPIGQHGGLSSEEMLVPLAVTTLDKLK